MTIKTKKTKQYSWNQKQVTSIDFSKTFMYKKKLKCNQPAINPMAPRESMQPPPLSKTGSKSTANILTRASVNLAQLRKVQEVECKSTLGMIFTCHPPPPKYFIKFLGQLIQRGLIIFNNYSFLFFFLIFNNYSSLQMEQWFDS